MAHYLSVLIIRRSDGGIGAALVSAFVKRGFYVFATAGKHVNLTLASLDHLALLISYVTKPSDIETVMERVSKETGAILTYSLPSLLGSLAPTKQQVEYLTG
jgi:NAD(P)-dependent dehydrogenase (short-subunit alcohol dehydrogenase family)